MADRVISVEIGNTLTRVSEVDSGKQLKVHSTFTMPTPDGVVRELGVEPTEEFVSAFKRAMSSKGIKTKKVIFSINSTRIASREVTIPYVKENKILDILRANLADYFPIDVTQYVFSHSIIARLYEGGEILTDSIDEEEDDMDDFDDSPKGKKGKAKKAPKAKKPAKATPKGLSKPTGYKLLLLAAPKNLLGSYERMASALDLNVVAMDYSGNSLYNAAKNACSGGTQMIVKIDDSSSNIMVLENGSIALTRTIPYGVYEAYKSIMDSESFGDIRTLGKAISLTKSKTVIFTDYAEADEVDFGEEPKPEPEKTTEDEADFLEDFYDAVDVRDTKKRKPTKKSDLVLAEKKEITEALRATINGITRVLDFYNSSHSEEPVDKLIITGMGADFAGLSILLGNESGLKVRKLGNIGHLDATRVFRDAAFSEYVTCIGAAIEPVSFYPDKDETTKKVGGKTDPIRAGVLVLVLGIVASAGMVVYMYLPYYQEKKLNDQYNRTITELQPSYDIYQQYLAELNQNESLHGMDDATRNRNSEMVDFISALESSMPASFTVESMNADKEVVEISATVSTKEEVAYVLDKLMQEEAFVETEISSARMTESALGESVYAFTITMYYAPLDYEYAEEEANQ